MDSTSLGEVYMAVPDFQFFMLPFLNELSDGKEHTLQSLYKVLAQKANLTDEEKDELLPSGKQRVFHNRIGWARTYLKKAGLLDTVKLGVFKITSVGTQLLQTNPPEINKSTLEQYPLFIEWQHKGKRPLSPSYIKPSSGATLVPNAAMSPTDQMEASFSIIEDELSDEILTLIREGSPKFFEVLVVDLMLAMGYGGWSKDSGKATQYSSDGGIDGIINEDPLGLETIYLQAKRYKESNTVGRPDIQAFSGALDMQRARKGVFITTSKFSNDALNYVQLIEKKIVLIDGQQLAEMMIKYNLGVSIKTTYQVKNIDTDYFNEEQ
jgi:restriction system protein